MILPRWAELLLKYYGRESLVFSFVTRQSGRVRRGITPLTGALLDPASARRGTIGILWAMFNVLLGKVTVVNVRVLGSGEAVAAGAGGAQPGVSACKQLAHLHSSVEMIYSPDWTSYSVVSTILSVLAPRCSTRGLSTSCRPGAGSSAPSALRAPLHKTFKLIKTTDRSITTCVVGEEHAVRVVLAGGLTVARLAQVLDMFYQRSFLVLAQPARPELGAAIPGLQTVIALVCSTIHSIYYIEMDKLHKRG